MRSESHDIERFEQVMILQNKAKYVYVFQLFTLNAETASQQLLTNYMDSSWTVSLISLLKL